MRNNINLDNTSLDATLCTAELVKETIHHQHNHYPIKNQLN